LYEPLDCADGYINTAPVDAEGLAPNPQGVHHILGNVWEWVSDCWYDYQDAPASAVTVDQDYQEAPSKDCTYRVLRGGSWYNEARFLRASVRNWYSPDDAFDGIGLRLARSN
jgi:formylglycine-generating enzyme required for sulfatase activity